MKEKIVESVLLAFAVLAVLAGPALVLASVILATRFLVGSPIDLSTVSELGLLGAVFTGMFTWFLIELKRSDDRHEKWLKDHDND